MDTPSGSGSGPVRDVDDFLGPGPWTCKGCGKSFKYQALLLRHKMTKHLDSGADKPPQIKCGKCDEVFSSKSDHGKHFRKFHADYKCRKCPKKFSTYSIMKYHLQLHSDARPYACSTCSKSFRTQRHLTQHEVTHSTTYSFVCDQVNVHFLLIRIPFQGIINTQKYGIHNILCQNSQCGKAYQSKHYLDNHYRYTHRGIKHYLQVKEREAKAKMAQSQSNPTAITNPNQDQDQRVEEDKT